MLLFHSVCLSCLSVTFFKASLGLFMQYCMPLVLLYVASAMEEVCSQLSGDFCW